MIRRGVSHTCEKGDCERIACEWIGETWGGWAWALQYVMYWCGGGGWAGDVGNCAISLHMPHAPPPPLASRTVL